jgi:hypothetical protein
VNFGLVTERFLPLFVAVLTLAFCLLWQESIVVFFAAHKLNVTKLYDAVFGWSAIQTGFVFGVYGFVVGSQSDFIAGVQGTEAMQRFLGYARNATVIGFILTFCSMPLMVAELNVSQGGYIYITIATWFALFICAFLSFARVAYLFGLLARPKSKPFIPG